MPKLPEEFADLERFTDWCLPDEEERYQKRLTSTMAEMQDFYDAGFLGSRTSWPTVDARFPLDGMPDDAKALIHMMQSLVNVSVPDRGVEAAARARQRRRLYRTASRSRWSERC